MYSRKKIAVQGWGCKFLNVEMTEEAGYNSS